MKKNTHLNRLWIIAGFFILLLSILIARMYDLTVLNRKFLQGQGNARSLRTIDIPAYRGMITDRNNVPLAVSTPVKSIWVNPKSFDPSKSQLKHLCELIQLTPLDVKKHLKLMQGKEFVYLQRQLPPALAKQIESLDIEGLHFQEEFKRYYPQGESTAQLIGFTNVDDNGIEGLELAYQQWLMGVPGKRQVVKDRTGQIMEELGVLKEPRPGHDLKLSIDTRIQYFAYHELQDTIEKYAAKAGSIVVLDAQNGEVLAVVNAPSFNPNARYHYTTERYRNKAISDMFEPGSVIKALTVAYALENGLVKPDTIIDTRPSYMQVHGRTIRDIHNYGVLDVTGVLQRSSNVGVTKMLLGSPPEGFINLLTKAGIGQHTGSGYPGESEGTIVKVADANPFVLATLGFGYGMSVTVLQLAKSYLIFANQGQLLPVSLLHYDKPIERVEVISPKTANQVLNMLEAVVEADGTGKQARIPGYRVAGKTGTARIAGKHGYSDRRYISSFVGIAPASNPRLIVAVVIHEPTRLEYYGGSVAGPLFAKVMGDALRTLDIQPDQPIRPTE